MGHLLPSASLSKFDPFGKHLDPRCHFDALGYHFELPSILSRAGTSLIPLGTILTFWVGWHFDTSLIALGTMSMPSGTILMPSGTVLIPAGTISMPLGTILILSGTILIPWVPL